MKDIIQSTISQIKKEHIKPESRWKFLLKKYGLWMGFIMIILIAAFSLLATWDLVSQLDWDLYRYAGSGPLWYVLSLLPYFWIGVITILMMGAFWDLRKTQSGYKLSRMKILTFSLLAVLVFGSLILFSGWGNRFNGMMEKNMPMYGSGLMMTKQSQWMQPSKGFLAGTITSINTNSLEIEDLNGNSWNMTKDENTLVRPLVKINKGEIIKIIGKQTSQNEFQAQEIRPWMGQGMMGSPSGRGMGPGMMR